MLTSKATKPTTATIFGVTSTTPAANTSMAGEDRIAGDREHAGTHQNGGLTGIHADPPGLSHVDLGVHRRDDADHRHDDADRMEPGQVDQRRDRAEELQHRAATAITNAATKPIPASHSSEPIRPLMP